MLNSPKSPDMPVIGFPHKKFLLKVLEKMSEQLPFE